MVCGSGEWEQGQADGPARAPGRQQVGREEVSPQLQDSQVSPAREPNNCQPAGSQRVITATATERVCQSGPLVNAQEEAGTRLSGEGASQPAIPSRGHRKQWKGQAKEQQNKQWLHPPPPHTHTDRQSLSPVSSSSVAASRRGEVGATCSGHQSKEGEPENENVCPQPASQQPAKAAAETQEDVGVVWVCARANVWNTERRELPSHASRESLTGRGGLLPVKCPLDRPTRQAQLSPCQPRGPRAEVPPEPPHTPLCSQALPGLCPAPNS